jgi:hypothetical protein
MAIDVEDIEIYGDGESFPATETSIALIGGQGEDLAGSKRDHIGKLSSLC